MEKTIEKLFKSAENLGEIKVSIVAMSRMALEIVSCATEIIKKIDNLELRYSNINRLLDKGKTDAERVVDVLENVEKRQQQRIAIAPGNKND